MNIQKYNTTNEYEKMKKEYGKKQIHKWLNESTQKK